MSNRATRRHPPKPTTPEHRISVMQALETAVLLLEQAGETEEDTMKYVHLIRLGLIRNGSLTPEYVQLAAAAQAERAAAEARAEAETLIIDTSNRRLV